MKAQMNAKEFMVMQKNSNEIEKEVYVMYSHPYTSFFTMLFLNYARFTTAFFPQKAIPIFTID